MAVDESERARRSVTVVSRRPQQVRRLLSIEKLRLPNYPRVEELRVSEFTDSVGDPAIDVFVILAEHPQRQDYRWDELKPIQDEVFRVLREAGDERFPYVRFATANEL